MTAARSQARWHRVSDCGRPGAGKGVHAWLCASASWCVCERAVPGPSAVARALSSLQSSPSVSVNDQATTWQGGGGGATAGFAPRPAASPCSCGHHSTTRRHAPSAHVHGNVANISVGIQRRRLKKWTELATQLCSPPVVSRSSALSASKRATGHSLLHRCSRQRCCSPRATSCAWQHRCSGGAESVHRWWGADTSAHLGRCFHIGAVLQQATDDSSMAFLAGEYKRRVPILRIRKCQRRAVIPARSMPSFLGKCEQQNPKFRLIRQQPCFKAAQQRELTSSAESALAPRSRSNSTSSTLRAQTARNRAVLPP